MEGKEEVEPPKLLLGEGKGESKLEELVVGDSWEESVAPGVEVAYKS